MRRDGNAQDRVTLENLEPRLLLSAGLLTHGSEGTEEDLSPTHYVQVIGPATGVPSSTSLIPAVAVPDYRWLRDNANYDWWFGCAPTAVGMLAAYWDHMLKTADFTFDVFPGDPTKWVDTDITSLQDWIYTDPSRIFADIDRRGVIESELFTVPKYANGVVSGWRHLYEADWASHWEDPGSGVPGARDYEEEFALDTWKGHAPDSIADFLLTETILENPTPYSPDFGFTVFSVTDPDAIAHGIENFMAWDDPRTPENESWSVSTTYAYRDNWTLSSYQSSILSGHPVILFLEGQDEDTGEITTHTVLGVGYEVTPATGPTTDPPDLMWVYTTWGSLEAWEYGEMTDPDDRTTWTTEDDSGYDFTVVGGLILGEPTRISSGLTGYFALAHPAIEGLQEIYIGLEADGQSVWQSANLAGGSGTNLVRTDIDLSGAMTALQDLHAAGKPEQWYLLVRTNSGVDPEYASEIMDFQIRYNGRTWSTGNMGFPIFPGEGNPIYLTTDLMGSVSGRSFDDPNGNGQADPGEGPIAGQTITIFEDTNANGRFDLHEYHDSTVTGPNGEYSFTALAPGTYVVAPVLESGQLPTTSLFCTIPLGGGEVTGVDFGMYRTGAISGKVWNDLDGDGLEDTGEPGLGGIDVWVDLNGDTELQAPTTVLRSALDLPLETIDLGTVTSQMELSELSGVVLDLDVKLILYHEWLEDLDVVLVSPSGTMVTLASGLPGDGYVNTGFDDEAANPISDGSGTYGGTWRPQTPLSQLDGEDPNGTWTLLVNDSVYHADTGALLSFRITMDLGEPVAQTATDGTYLIEGLIPGDYQVMAGPGYGWEFTTAASQTVSVIGGSETQNVNFGARLPDLPDLQSTGEGESSYAPSIVVPGEDWSAYWSVTNAGTAAAGQFDVAFYASPDPLITEDDHLIGVVTVGSLDSIPGSNVAEIELLFDTDPETPQGAFPDIRVGQYYVGVIIDPANDIIESDEANNTAIDESYPLTIPGIRGRAWAELTGNAVLDAEDPLLEGWTVFLDGTGNGTVDGILTGTEIRTVVDSDGYYSFAGLDVGNYLVTLRIDPTWPASVPVDTVLVIVENTVTTYTGNDLSVVPPFDLYSSGPETSYFTPGTVTIGETWDVGWDITNGGDGWITEGRLDFYAYSDGQQVANGYLLGSADISANPIAPGASQTFQLPMTAFPQMPAGIYHVGVVIDPDNNVWESDETNNTATDDDLLVVLGAADLSPGEGVWIGGSPGVVSSGEVLRMVWSVTNIGSAPAGGFVADLYASTDPTISSADFRIARGSVPGLAVGNDTDIEFRIYSPSELPVGQYYVGIIIDSEDVVDESNENNNVAAETGDLIGIPGVRGTVWDDTDGDGIWRGGGDPVLMGRVIFLDTDGDGLLDPGERYTRTDRRGEYWFTGLGPADYNVTQLMGVLQTDRPGGWINWGQTTIGTNPEGAYQVSYGEDEFITEGLNFGNALLSKVGGRVWHDRNGDGYCQSPEYALVGWTVEIFRDSDRDGLWDPGEWRDSTETASLADPFDWAPFQFADLLPGAYVVKTALVPYPRLEDPIFTMPGDTISLEITKGQLIGHNDFGVANSQTISGTVWEDMNRDGFRDTNDFGLGGWRVDLSTGQVAYTDGEGHYEFTGLAPGYYWVSEEWRSGWTPTSPASGSRTVTVVSNWGSGGVFPDVDFGNYRPGQIVGTVWEDSDPDGYMAPEEMGRVFGAVVFINDPNIPNVTLDWTDGDGDFLWDPGEGEQWTTTGFDGTFVLSGLDPGSYEFRIQAPGAWVQSYPDAGTNWAHTAFISSGTVYGLSEWEDSDFGLYRSGEIRGMKFNDLNGNGLRDGGDVGIPGWTIYLDQNRNDVLDWSDINGNLIWDPGEGERFTTTDGGGYYAFTGLIPASTYLVAEQHEPGWVQSYPSPDGTHSVSVASGQIVTGCDFGNYLLGEIHGVKWNDLNSNGVLDEGEPGLQDWVIFIDDNYNQQRDWTDGDDDDEWDEGEGERFVRTDENGEYVFTDLSPGTYLVNEEIQPTWTRTYPQSSYGQWVQIVSGIWAYDVNFGNTQLAVISGNLWEDMDGDGIREGGDGPLEGWKVFFDNNRNGVHDFQDIIDDDIWSGDVEGERYVVTDEMGNYQFDGVWAGSYYIAEEVQPGWSRTFPNTPDYPVTVASGDAVGGLDFGNTKRAGIRGYKWNDLDADGVWDFNEPGIGGWAITLFRDLDGDKLLDPEEGDSFAAAVTTSSGWYQFSQLLPGTYIVRETPQTDWVRTHPYPLDYHEIVIVSGESTEQANFGNARVIANPLALLGDEDVPLFNQVTGLDPEGGFVTFSLVDAPDHALSFQMYANGQFQYTPQSNWSGVDSFTFQATSATGKVSDPADVTMTIRPVNDRPKAFPASVSGDENSTIVIPLGADDVETNPDDLVYAVTTDPQHGSVTLIDNVAYYTPDSGYVGPDSFGFAVTDTGDPAGIATSPVLQSVEAIVSITVNAKNAAPVANSQLCAAPYDYQGKPIEIILSGSDPEGGSLTYQILKPPVHGTVVLVGNVATYTPAPGSTGGSDQFTFTVTDTGNPPGSGVDVLTSAPGTVTVALPTYEYFSQGMNAVRQYAENSVIWQIRGPGQGIVYYSEADPLLIERVILIGTTERTTVNVRVRSPLFYKLGDVEIRGSIRSLDAKALSLVGNITVQGWAGTLTLGDTLPGTGQHLIDIGPGAKPVRLLFGRVSDLTINSGSPIQMLKLTSWSDTDATADMLTAPTVRMLTTSGDRRLGVSGHFQAGLDVIELGSARIAGSLSNVLWDIDKDLRMLAVTGRIVNGTVIVGGNARGITAAQWDGGLLQAFSVGSVGIKGNRRDPSVTGDFRADLTLTGWDARGNSLGRFSAYGSIVDSDMSFAGSAGSISAAQWNGGSLQGTTVRSLTTKGNRRNPGITGDFSADVLLTSADTRGLSLGRMSVYGTARDTTVRTAGSMGGIMLGATEGSDFLAGIDPAVGRRPTDPGHFVNVLASIGSVRVKGFRLPRGVIPPRFVIDSNFSAATIGTVNLMNVEFDNSGNPFGLFALNQGTGREIRSVSYRDTLTGERWRYPTAGPVFTHPDLVIEII